MFCTSLFLNPSPMPQKDSNMVVDFGPFLGSHPLLLLLLLASSSACTAPAHWQYNFLLLRCSGRRRKLAQLSLTAAACRLCTLRQLPLIVIWGRALHCVALWCNWDSANIFDLTQLKIRKLRQILTAAMSLGCWTVFKLLTEYNIANNSTVMSTAFAVLLPLLFEGDYYNQKLCSFNDLWYASTSLTVMKFLIRYKYTKILQKTVCRYKFTRFLKKLLQQTSKVHWIAEKPITVI